MIRKAALALGLIASMITTSALAGAVHDTDLFTTNSLARNDDSSTGLVSLGFTVNFFGRSFNQLYVNNNGNVTFDAPLSTFTPFGLLNTSKPMLAPFFADVDTRNTASKLVQYGQSSIGGRQVFGVNWVDVGYFSSQADKTNSFQLIVTDRSDTGAGNFDFQFNYDRITWETGSASGGTNGFGGNSARAGWSNGTTTSFEAVGSAINGALLDNGPNALIHNSRNSNIAGQYNFEVRNGTVTTPVPEPETYAMLIAGLSLVGTIVRRRRSAASA